MFLDQSFVANPLELQGASKKTGIMEVCIFFVKKGEFTIKITVSNSCMIKIYTIGYYSCFYSSMRYNI
jgi:hypothetical protein